MALRWDAFGRRVHRYLGVPLELPCRCGAWSRLGAHNPNPTSETRLEFPPEVNKNTETDHSEEKHRVLSPYRRLGQCSSSQDLFPTPMPCAHSGKDAVDHAQDGQQAHEQVFASAPMYCIVLASVGEDHSAQLRDPETCFPAISLAVRKRPKNKGRTSIHDHESKTIRYQLLRRVITSPTPSPLLHYPPSIHYPTNTCWAS